MVGDFGGVGDSLLRAFAELFVVDQFAEQALLFLEFCGALGETCDELFGLVVEFGLFDKLAQTAVGGVDRR